MPRFMEHHDITWMVAMMGEGHEVRHSDFDINGIPHVAILDAEGRVRYNVLHPMDEGQAEKIDGLLREAGIAVPGD